MAALPMDFLPLPSAHAQTTFALTRQADLWSAESGQRVGVRGMSGDRKARQRPAPLTPTLSPEGRGNNGTPLHFPDTDRPRPTPC